jgi:hypothetical protein
MFMIVFRGLRLDLDQTSGFAAYLPESHAEFDAFFRASAGQSAARQCWNSRQTR